MALLPLFNVGPVDPDATPQVSPDSSALFFDAFDGALSNFTAGGTTPTISAGQATFASSTTASAASYMRSNGTFALRPQAYLRAGYFVQATETTTAITNNSRWWGYGQNQTTPTAAAPVLNGAVFLIDYADGAMKAAIYSAGTRTQVAAITRPTDGALHKYEIWWRQAVVYFLIDGVTVASITYPNTAVTSGMYLVSGSVNYTTAPSTAPVLRISSASMADTSGTNRTVSDGANPYLQQTVKQGSVPAVTAADNPAQVQAVPPPGLLVTSTAAAASAATATLAAPGSGLRHYVTSVTFERYVTATLTASATPIVTTASNHAFVTTIQADGATLGVRTEVSRTFGPVGVGSTAQNTATSFTAPATTGVLWRVTVTYYVAP